MVSWGRADVDICSVSDPRSRSSIHIPKRQFTMALCTVGGRRDIKIGGELTAAATSRSLVVLPLFPRFCAWCLVGVRWNKLSSRLRKGVSLNLGLHFPLQANHDKSTHDQNKTLEGQMRWNGNFSRAENNPNDLEWCQFTPSSLRVKVASLLTLSLA